MSTRRLIKPQDIVMELVIVKRFSEIEEIVPICYGKIYSKLNTKYRKYFDVFYFMLSSVCLCSAFKTFKEAKEAQNADFYYLGQHINVLLSVLLSGTLASYVYCSNFQCTNEL